MCSTQRWWQSRAASRVEGTVPDLRAPGRQRVPLPLSVRRAGGSSWDVSWVLTQACGGPEGFPGPASCPGLGGVVGRLPQRLLVARLGLGLTG